MGVDPPTCPHPYFHPDDWFVVIPSHRPTCSVFAFYRLRVSSTNDGGNLHMLHFPTPQFYRGDIPPGGLLGSWVARDMTYSRHRRVTSAPFFSILLSEATSRKWEALINSCCDPDRPSGQEVSTTGASSPFCTNSTPVQQRCSSAP